MTPEGFSAINFEHSWGDGVAVLRFFEETYKDRKQYLSYCEPTMEGVKQLEFSVPAEVKQETVAAVREVKETCDNLSVHIMQYHRYGKDFIKKMKLSPDAVLQLAIQVRFKWDGQTMGGWGYSAQFCINLVLLLNNVE